MALKGSNEALRQSANRLAARNPQAIVNLARKHSVRAIAYLAQWMEDVTLPPACRIKCAEMIIERGYGKAPQSVTLEEAPGTNALTGRVLSIAERIIMLKMAQERGGQTLDLENSQLKLVEPVEVRPAAEDLVG